MSKKKTGPVTELEQRLAEAEARCEELLRQEKEHRDAALRAAADFENFRRRARQEISEARQRGVESVMCGLIPVLDSFDRALGIDAGEHSVEAVRKGVHLILRQFQSALEAHGLRRFSCIGERFDPRRAEAVGFQPDPEQERETVVAEECCGYQCAERVIRPARVVVARPPEPVVDNGPDRPDDDGTDKRSGMDDE